MRSGHRRRSVAKLVAVAFVISAASVVASPGVAAADAGAGHGTAGVCSDYQVCKPDPR